MKINDNEKSDIEISIDCSSSVIDHYQSNQDCDSYYKGQVVELMKLKSTKLQQKFDEPAKYYKHQIDLVKEKTQRMRDNKLNQSLGDLGLPVNIKLQSEASSPVQWGDFQQVGGGEKLGCSIKQEGLISPTQKDQNKFIFCQKFSPRTKSGQQCRSATSQEIYQNQNLKISEKELPLKREQVLLRNEKQQIKIQFQNDQKIVIIEQRFDKDFFQRLDSQAIGFSTLLKNRKSSPIHLRRAQSHQSEKTEKFDGRDNRIKLVSFNQNQLDSPFKKIGDSNARNEGQDYFINQESSTLSIELSDTKGKRYLQDLILQIQRNNNFKKIIQEAIIFFKQKPRKAFNFLIQKNAIDLEKQQEQKAEFLLSTQGLSKQAVGQYIGKPENELILKMFCMKIDFTNMRIDQALRLFLSRFILPGEGQQIQRIIQAFSYQYYKDNSKLFQDPHNAYILAFTLIMVNTSEHNKSSKNRLCLDRFIQMNQNAMPLINKTTLEVLYNSIKENQIKTMVQCNHSTYTQKIYERIVAMKQARSLKREYIFEHITRGDYFIKFCRNGNKKRRFIFYDRIQNKVCWKDKQDGSRCRFININDIIDIRVGINTTLNIQRHKIPLQLDDLCFSIVTKSRSLDLQARNSNTRSNWVAFLINVSQIKYKKPDRSTVYQAKKVDQKIKNKFQIVQIWQTDIIPHIQDYWDFILNCPRTINFSTKKHSKNLSEGK